MGHFGTSEHISEAVQYPGNVAKRLATFLVAPNRGSPLRSLTRSSVLGTGLRLPTNAIDGLWANEPYLMRLVAAGPALRVPETLYLRWDKREGGLTDGWRGLPLEQLRSGYRANASTVLEIIDTAEISEAEKKAVRFCAYLRAMLQIRKLERTHAVVDPMPAGDVHSAFVDSQVPKELAILGPQIEAWAMQFFAHLQDIERSLAARETG